MSQQQTPGVEGAGLDKPLQQAVQRAQHVVTGPGQDRVGNNGFVFLAEGDNDWSLSPKCLR